LGGMLARSGRLPQLTQITGTRALRSAGSSFCRGLIGLRSGRKSPPIWSTQPPAVQKSFCMSITIIAVRRRSTFTDWRVAAIVTGFGAGEAAAMSISFALALHLK